MEGNIQLNNPQEVLAYISRESELLNRYAELINQEAQELSLLENLVAETMQLVNLRKRNVYVAIDQMKRYEDSDAKQRALRELQKKMEQYEEQARMINQCNDDLIGIRQDYASIVKDATTIADTSKTLSTKIQQLIERVIDAI
jgi:hypothetical protein